MNNIYMLDREDLLKHRKDALIDEITISDFKLKSISTKERETADIIEFYDDNTGMIKVLKSRYGKSDVDKKKEISSKRYLLEVDEKQLRTLQKACECFSRISTGQLRYALDEAWMDKLWSLPVDKNKELENLLRSVSLILSDGELDGFHGSYGIYSPEINPYATTAFNILQVIRNQFWKERPEDQRSNMTVDSSVSVFNEEKIKITPLREEDY